MKSRYRITALPVLQAPVLLEAAPSLPEIRKTKFTYFDLLFKRMADFKFNA